MTAILEISNLNVSFAIGGGRLDVIRDLNLKLERGRSLSMIGESGSGKSVIASAILASLERNALVSGEVLFNGESIYGMSKRRLEEVRGKGICLISQNASQSFDPLMRIGKQMGEFLLKTGTSPRLVREVISDSLHKCGFSDPDAVVGEYPHRLSGGMIQRVMIAMCTAADPEMLIADEPTKGLDGSSVTSVIDIMADVSRSRSFMMITHDLYVASCCMETLVLYGGVIIERGDSAKVLNEPKHPYTIALKASNPKNGMHPIPGSEARSPAAGCPFRNRCNIAEEECAREISMRHIDGVDVRCPFV